MASRNDEKAREYSYEYYHKNKEKCNAMCREWQRAKRGTHIEQQKDGITLIHIHHTISTEMEGKVRSAVKHSINPIFVNRQYILVVESASIEIMYKRVDDEFDNSVLEASETAIKEALKDVSVEKKRGRGNARKIAQYGLNGEFVRYWKGVTEIQNTIGYNSANISSCCSGRIKQAYNYIWKYVDSEAD